MVVTPSNPLRPSNIVRAARQGLPLVALGTGVLGSLIALWMATSPRAGLVGVGSIAGIEALPAANLFGITAQTSDVATQPMTFLTAIGGETFSSLPTQAASAQVEAGGPLPNVAPAAWDRLSAGGCMTLTTKAGQTFSFRIMGARPAVTGKPAEDMPTIDLAITACPTTGEPIAKAVIEPTKVPAGTAVTHERSL